MNHRDNSYGVRHQTTNSKVADLHVEELNRLGFTIVDSGLGKKEVDRIALVYEEVFEKYKAEFGVKRLEAISEHNGVRQPLRYDELFLDLAFNQNVLSVVEELLDRNFVLNQQNGICNPAKQSYNQGNWHRDLPYQHFTSSAPLALNALFCIDDFTLENGSTVVVPGSHLSINFPSEEFIEKYATQVVAKKGEFIILDCMTYHKGGSNISDLPRRAVNHVYSTPIIARQITFDGATIKKAEARFPGAAKYLAGNNGFSTVAAFLESRMNRVDDD